ncbi:MAG: hypothetical protein ACRDQ4_01095 [Pseudonocardiaceae bacterium]
MLLLSRQLTMLSLAFIPLFAWLTERVGRAWRAVRFSSQQMIGQGFFVSMQVFFAVMPVRAYLAAGFVLPNGATGVHLTAGTLAAFTTLQM